MSILNQLLGNNSKLYEIGKILKPAVTRYYAICKPPKGQEHKCPSKKKKDPCPKKADTKSGCNLRKLLCLGKKVECPPKKEECPPKKEECPPKKEKCPPKKEVCPPKKEVCPPSKHLCPPKKEECPPKKEECPPKIVDCPPKKDDCAPKKVDCPPEKDECAPKKDKCPPKSDKCTIKLKQPCEDFLKDKVALITGAGAGIGLACMKHLFRNGLKAATIADIEPCKGEEACRQITKEFGDNRAIYVKCDVTKSELVDWAFKNTIRKFDRLDLVINNAGILNEKKWEKQVVINSSGVIIGSLLALQYMSKSCVGTGGTVINVASTMGIVPQCGCPIHTMTQFGIVGFTRSLGYGNHFDRTGVRVMALCPGPTNTQLLAEAVDNCINEKFGKELEMEWEDVPIQEPCHVALAMIKMLKAGSNGSVWVCDNCLPPYEVNFPELSQMQTC